ncbi:SatD family protein [Aeromicrobium halocynthiae]|uniref:SatD family protein n=1 Tax=Aeromicrobium halocynthiae TaxID=560557 RepID=UPI0031D95C33
MTSSASPKPVHAVIGDVVGSREHASRRAVQEALVRALEVADAGVTSIQRPEPTIGDEFQSVHAELADALVVTVLVRLALPEELDVRFGIGIGTLEVVGSSPYGLTQDGPAWWAARQAVVEVGERQRSMPHLRTRVVPAPTAASPDTGLVNAYLETRDFIVTGFDGRLRRIAAGLLAGRSIGQIADSEGISASAVSQRVRRGGVRALTESVAHLPRGAS